MKRKIFFSLLLVVLVAMGGLFYLKTAPFETERETPNAQVSSSSSVHNPPNGSITPSLRIVEEEKTVARDAYHIYGKLFAPENYQRKKLPLIILSHGFGNTLEFVAPYAELLAHKGYLVYAFDFVGGSPNSRSGGSMLEMSVFTEQADLQAVIDQFSQEAYVDVENLVLMGYSQGGVVSTLAAIDNPQIKGLVSVNGAFVLFDDAKALFPTQDSIPEIYNHRGTNLGKVYFEQLLETDIYKEMMKVTAEALIIQGNQDEIIPVSSAERAVQAIPHASLKVIDGGRHILNETETLEALQAIDQYLTTIVTK
ncbi:alpha/beta hydrolase [Streptococcus himalayensis]|uniref:Cinnamoyl ester hydrolase n=1 Tax=Streptococcus himalayensis TaxID=1888195 RepID=A0A917A4M1_9STRE|nr:alpha/beta fold hydrolase [Streptococcus himalayensis]GGE26702.1 cinnamoyl ester hydrolase [Streptococcus himalayensis]